MRRSSRYPNRPSCRRWSRRRWRRLSRPERPRPRRCKPPLRRPPDRPRHRPPPRRSRRRPRRVPPLRWSPSAGRRQRNLTAQAEPRPTTEPRRAGRDARPVDRRRHATASAAHHRARRTHRRDAARRLGARHGRPFEPAATGPDPGRPEGDRPVPAARPLGPGMTDTPESPEPAVARRRPTSRPRVRPRYRRGAARADAVPRMETVRVTAPDLEAPRGAWRRRARGWCCRRRRLRRAVRSPCVLKLADATIIQPLPPHRPRTPDRRSCSTRRSRPQAQSPMACAARARITDRNGQILAISLPTAGAVRQPARDDRLRRMPRTS